MESNSTVSESHRSQRCRVPARPLHQVVEAKLGLHWGPQDTGDIRAMGHIRRRAAYREWSQHNLEEACSKAGETEHHLRPLKPDMEQQHLVFALLSLCLALVQ